MTSIIYSTMGSSAEATQIARILVEERLVACVNIIPTVQSIYRWKGAIEEDTECVLIAKTADTKIEQTVKRVQALHSYDVPDIVVFPISTGYEPYLHWIEEETA